MQPGFKYSCFEQIYLGAKTGKCPSVTGSVPTLPSADAFHIFVNPSRERTDGTGAERKISSANLIAFYALLLIVALKQEAAVGIGKSSHVTRSVECE